MNTASFEYNGAKVTVRKPNGFSRVKVWQLRQELAQNNAPLYELGALFCYYLANTIAVEGSLGFPVPIESPTPAELEAFIMGLGEEDERLVSLWDEAIEQVKVATNDPDLLPPDELPEKKETPKKSKSNA